MGQLFGTDGVRGVANTQLTAELAMNIGRAAGTVLTGDTRRRPRFVVGCDTRRSSDMLVSALCAGLCAAGAEVWQVGVVPTPAVAFFIGTYKADAGVMVSASHNPAAYNGIKLFGGDGFKLPDALEERIESVVLSGNRPEPSETVGTVTTPPDALTAYIQHVQSTALYSLDGLRIAVDCAEGSASRTAKPLFEGLGATCTFLHHQPNGWNINDRCGSTHLEDLIGCVVENGLDAGVAFDGDADRCLCVDNRGQVVDGDGMMAICALDMKQRGRLTKNTVVGTVMTNLGFLRFCDSQDIRFLSTKVGDRYVLEEMQLSGAGFGGEPSGHLIFRDFATTGDGQLTAVQLLSLIRRSGQSLSELAQCMTPYPQIHRNIPVSAEGKLRFYTDADLRQAIEKAEHTLGESGRLVVRVSGTEPMVRVMAESERAADAEQMAEDIAEVVRRRLTDES